MQDLPLPEPEALSAEVTPLSLTKNVRDISVTERNEFKSCHRKWYLSTIRNLEPVGVRTWYYDFGTGVHAGLEAYYKTLGGLLNGDPLVNAEDAFGEWYEEMDAEIVSAGYGDSTSEFRNELLEFNELGLGMLNNYAIYADMEDDFTICAVEGQWTREGIDLLREHMDPPYAPDMYPALHESGRYMTPIIDPEAGVWLPGQPYLTGKLDLIVYIRKTGLTGFWVIDHKTAGSSPSDRGIDMDDQITGYDYKFWRLTGIIPRGTIFNYLIKQLPKQPRFIKPTKANPSGLSAAKDQLTTPDLYRQAMVDAGIMVNGKIMSEPHEAVYLALTQHGWGRFFKRMQVQRNEHELRAFEARLPIEHQQMVQAAKEPGWYAYPHLSQYNCPGCPVMRICQAMEDGSDADFIIETGFKEAADRKAK